MRKRVTIKELKECIPAIYFERYRLNISGLNFTAHAGSNYYSVFFEESIFLETSEVSMTIETEQFYFIFWANVTVIHFAFYLPE